MFSSRWTSVPKPTVGPAGLQQSSTIHLCSDSVSAIVIRSIPMARASSTGAVPSTLNWFASISNSSPTPHFHERDVARERLRIWTSEPPRAKCTSSIYAFISWMPRPCSEAGSDVMPLPTTFSTSKPFPSSVTTMDSSLPGLAAAADVSLCFWIFLIAVHDRIVERFAERQLDIELFSRDALRSFNQPHQAVHERRDRSNFARHPSINFQDGRPGAFS